MDCVKLRDTFLPMSDDAMIASLDDGSALEALLHFTRLTAYAVLLSAHECFSVCCVVRIAQVCWFA